MTDQAVRYEDATDLLTSPIPEKEVKHKTLSLEAVTQVKVIDVENGIVEALVSCSNNTDSDGERFRPGAWGKWLKRRRPKGCHAHMWSQPVAKTLEAEELMPGDPRLPAKHRKNGWGGLRVVGQYNLATQRGRESFSDVVFFGKEAEFSVGFRAHRMTDATEAEAKEDPAFRAWIEEAELYEWSDVLFGANPETQVLSRMKGARSAVVDWMADMARASGVKEAEINRDVLGTRADELIARLAKEANVDDATEKCQVCEATLAEKAEGDLAPFCADCVTLMAEYAAATKTDDGPTLTIKIDGDMTPELAEKLAEQIAEEMQRARSAHTESGTLDESGEHPCGGCAEKGKSLVVLDGVGYCETCTTEMRKAADDAINVKDLVAFPAAALAELNA